MELTVNVKIGFSTEVKEFLKQLQLQAVAASSPAAKTLIKKLDLQPTPTPTAEQPAGKEYTVEDVRAAIHKTRARVYGNDAAKQAKYKDALTAQFRLIAFSLEKTERPSELSTPELRRRFCEECDKLEVNARGEIKPKEEF